MMVRILYSVYSIQIFVNKKASSRMHPVNGSIREFIKWKKLERKDKTAPHVVDNPTGVMYLVMPAMITITCQSCSKVYRIPSEKLPKGKKFAIPCPNCKSPIRIDPIPIPPAPEPPARTKIVSNRPSPQKTKKPLTGLALKKKVLESVKDLPPMPHIVLKAQEIMANPNSGIRELTKIIQTDQAIAGRMIKLANSAFYGLSGKVANVQKAITMLGQQTLREILLTAGYAGLLDKTLKGYGYATGDLWRHSIAVGIGAKIIADTVSQENASEAYLAGLIHDSGKLILDPLIHELRPAFDEYLADESRTFLNAERQLLGFDHADIAFDVCRKWHVPEATATAVRFHHRPLTSSANTLAHIIHLSDFIARTGGLGYGDEDHMYLVEEGTIEHLKLDANAVQKISAKVIEAMLQFQD